jgi:SAM-dependent methyltransferase
VAPQPATIAATNVRISAARPGRLVMSLSSRLRIVSPSPWIVAPRDHGHMSTFDERARTWDTPERRARAEAVADAIRAAVPLTRDMRAIEVGAGTGLLGLALAGDVGELVLADPSAGMLEVAREKLAVRGDAQVSAVHLDLLADPPPQPPFDLAVSLLVLHHLPDPVAALRAFGALLRPGGWLALADLETEDGSFHSADAEGIHHRGFDPDRLAAAAADAGLVDASVRPATVIEKDNRQFPLLLLVGRRP